jgi:hypothetical protein
MGCAVGCIHIEKLSTSGKLRSDAASMGGDNKAG